jgi:phosphomannomutase
MTAHFIFDIDGTLTPSRGTIDPEFFDFFREFQENHLTYYATGSDRPKTLEQMTDLSRFVLGFNCLGNQVFSGEKCVWQNNWVLSPEIINFLDKMLEHHPWEDKTGNHVEHRVGLINFSIVGRNSNLEQRRQYFEYDSLLGEDKWSRAWICRQINDEFFGQVEAQVGGQTGIDLTCPGCDKKQILEKWFDKQDEIIFFGDQCQIGGNDHSMYQAVTSRKWGTAHWVSDWKDTWRFLKKYA